MKKVVLKLDFFDEKIKQKAMKNVSSLSGVDSISMDMKDKKLTVTGDVDPVIVVSKLRKLCHTEIVSVGPAKEPEKKKDDSGSGAGANNKKEDDKKKGDDNKNKKPSSDSKDEALKFAYSVPAYHHHQQAYPYYNYQQPQPYYNYSNYNNPPVPYYSKVVNDESPNCVIC